MFKYQNPRLGLPTVGRQSSNEVQISILLTFRHLTFLERIGTFSNDVVAEDG
jgi:hypothetical protein